MTLQKNNNSKRKLHLIEKTTELTSKKTYQAKFYLNKDLYQLFKQACAKRSRSAASMVEHMMLNVIVEEQLI